MSTKKVIAIQCDHYNAGDHGAQSFSEKWADYLSHSDNYEPRLVDILSGGDLSSIAGADGFMMRPMGRNINYDLAKKIIPAVEHGMGIPTFPNSYFAWLARDKAAQSYWFAMAGIPAIPTWTFFSLESAKKFILSSRWPLVTKLTDGSQSDEVILLESENEATIFSEEMFRYGITHMYQATGKPTRRLLRRCRQAWDFLQGRQPPKARRGGYVYFQEFVPGNEFDVRVIVIGRFALAFRRYNRPGDFRASGSGNFEWGGCEQDVDAIELAFEVGDRLGCPFVAVDVLYRDGQPIICELNLGYLAWSVGNVAGYWRRDDGSVGGKGDLHFSKGKLDPYRLTLDEWLRFNNMQAVNER